MMDKQHSYEQRITEGIKGLPQELLAEIADFVYFVRQRFTQSQAFERNPPTANGGWQSLAGTISLDDLQLMSEAIEAGCEQVDPDEW
jgi:hypothetical protein